MKRILQFLAISHLLSAICLSTNNANGAVLVLKNTSASPSYLGAINFEDSAGTPGQIGYLASGQMAFRAGSQPRMTLDDTGLTVNGTFVSTSDRNIKQNFAAVDAQEVLEKVAAMPCKAGATRIVPA